MTWRWVAWPSATVLLRLNAACAGALAFELLYLAGPSKLHGRARRPASVRAQTLSACPLEKLPKGYGVLVR
jgi:hypothetical protein